MVKFIAVVRLRPAIGTYHDDGHRASLANAQIVYLGDEAVDLTNTQVELRRNLGERGLIWSCDASAT